MVKGSKVRLIDDSRIRSIATEFHGPTSRLHNIVNGSVGTVFATRAAHGDWGEDSSVLVKFPGYGSVLSLLRRNLQVV